MENTLKKPMTGIIPPLVTPLLDNDKLDIDLSSCTICRRTRK